MVTSEIWKTKPPKEFAWAATAEGVVASVQNRLERAGLWLDDVESLVAEVVRYLPTAGGPEVKLDAAGLQAAANAVGEACGRLRHVVPALHPGKDDETPAPSGSPRSVGEDIDGFLATIAASMPAVRKLGKVAFDLHMMLDDLTDPECRRLNVDEDSVVVGPDTDGDTDVDGIYVLPRQDGQCVVLDGGPLAAIGFHLRELLEGCWVALSLARRMRRDGGRRRPSLRTSCRVRRAA